MRPLENVRVVEYGPWLNTAYGGRLLADMGAEVIKVESPDGGDPGRIHGPFPGDAPDAEASAQHLFNNANKLGATLDPSSATGRRLFRRLAAAADILIDGTQSGELEALGLGHETLANDNPRLITVSVSSLGHSGPYAGYRGYDLTSWHGSGSSHIYMGAPDQEPLRGAYYHANHWGAVSAAAAAMIALHARETTGRGQTIDIAEAETLAMLYIAVEVSDYLMNGAEKARAGLRMDGNAPTALLPCKDGYVYLMCLTDEQWAGLVDAMDNPDWATTDLFLGGGRQRAVYAREIYDLLRPWLQANTAQEIFDRCQARSAPAAPLYTVADLMTNEHLAEREFFVDLPGKGSGPLRIPGPPFRFGRDQSETPASKTLAPWAVERRAPRLGEHNEAVYCGMLGLDRAELPGLRRAGVI